MTPSAPQACSALIGDIGGTNARFALVTPGEFLPREILTLPSAEYAGPAPTLLAWSLAPAPAWDGQLGAEPACLTGASVDRRHHVDRSQREKRCMASLAS